MAVEDPTAHTLALVKREWASDAVDAFVAALADNEIRLVLVDGREYPTRPDEPMIQRCKNEALARIGAS